MKLRTRIYDHNDYWEPLKADVLAAAGSIDIHVPFITQQGMARWGPILRERISQGVRVRVFLQRPRHWSKRGDIELTGDVLAEIRRLESLVNWLESIGVKVELRDGIHAKFTLIDDLILWEGSMN